jgi:hypothetical protein
MQYDDSNFELKQKLINWNKDPAKFELLETKLPTPISKTDFMLCLISLKIFAYPKL